MVKVLSGKARWLRLLLSLVLILGIMSTWLFTAAKAQYGWDEDRLMSPEEYCKTVKNGYTVLTYSKNGQVYLMKGSELTEYLMQGFVLAYPKVTYNLSGAAGRDTADALLSETSYKMCCAEFTTWLYQSYLPYVTQSIDDGSAWKTSYPSDIQYPHSIVGLLKCKDVAYAQATGCSVLKTVAAWLNQMSYYNGTASKGKHDFGVYLDKGTGEYYFSTQEQYWVLRSNPYGSSINAPTVFESVQYIDKIYNKDGTLKVSADKAAQIIADTINLGDLMTWSSNYDHAKNMNYGGNSGGQHITVYVGTYDSAYAAYVPETLKDSCTEGVTPMIIDCSSTYGLSYRPLASQLDSAKKSYLGASWYLTAKEEKTQGRYIKVRNTDGNGAALTGTEFTLYKDEACTVPLTKSDRKTPVTFTTNPDSSGYTYFQISGSVIAANSLNKDKNWCLYLKETKVPAGYSVTANDNGTDRAYKVYVPVTAIKKAGAYEICTKQEDGTWQGTPVINTHFCVAVVRTDNTGEVYLGGAVFSLYSAPKYNADGTLNPAAKQILTITTKENRKWNTACITPKQLTDAGIEVPEKNTDHSKITLYAYEATAPKGCSTNEKTQYTINIYYNNTKAANAAVIRASGVA